MLGKNILFSLFLCSYQKLYAILVEMNEFFSNGNKTYITGYISLYLRNTKYYLKSNQNKPVGCQFGSYLGRIKIPRKKEKNTRRRRVEVWECHQLNGADQVLPLNQTCSQPELPNWIPCPMPWSNKHSVSSASPVS